MQEFSGKHVLAYYTRDADRCTLVMSPDENPGPRVRVTLAPTQAATIEDVEGGAVVLTCGAEAASMTVERTAPRQRAATR